MDIRVKYYKRNDQIGHIKSAMRLLNSFQNYFYFIAEINYLRKIILRLLLTIITTFISINLAFEASYKYGALCRFIWIDYSNEQTTKICILKLRYRRKYIGCNKLSKRDQDNNGG